MEKITDMIISVAEKRTLVRRSLVLARTLRDELQLLIFQKRILKCGLSETKGYEVNLCTLKKRN